MIIEEDLEAVGRGHGTGLGPTPVDQVEIGPLQDLGGNRFADEGEVLQDPRGPVALLTLSAAYVERIDGDRAEGEVDLQLVRLGAKGMDRGLHDLVVELGAAV